MYVTDKHTFLSDNLLDCVKTDPNSTFLLASYALATERAGVFFLTKKMGVWELPKGCNPSISITGS